MRTGLGLGIAHWPKRGQGQPIFSRRACSPENPVGHSYCLPGSQALAGQKIFHGEAIFLQLWNTISPLNQRTSL